MQTVPVRRAEDMNSDSGSTAAISLVTYGDWPRGISVAGGPETILEELDAKASRVSRGDGGIEVGVSVREPECPAPEDGSIGNGVGG